MSSFWLWPLSTNIYLIPVKNQVTIDQKELSHSSCMCMCVYVHVCVCESEGQREGEVERGLTVEGSGGGEVERGLTVEGSGGGEVELVDGQTQRGTAPR